MQARSKLALAVCTVVATLALSPQSKADIVDEISVGGFAHDFNDIGHGKESGSADIQVEVDTTRPPILRLIGAPRVNVFAAVNTAGGVDSAGAGLVWDHRLFGQLYGFLDAGLAVNNGDLTAPLGPAGDHARANQLQLGSHVLFREALGLEWRFARHWAIAGEYIHQSNGQILAHGANEGINDLGLKLAYRFH